MNTNMNADISSQYSIAHVNNKHEIEVPKTCEYRLQLNNVAIAYSHANVLVKNINVELKGNQLLAITGPSGSGKSTLLNTIANYLPAIEGDIHISPNRDAYAPIAYLPQKPWIKNATLLENITEFAPSASEQQILSCLSMLGLADELSTRENGLNILLGEHGQGLSGGQMQRIALSRILLNPTPVVLLDEPTAKLDIYNKALVIKALRKLKQNAIVLVATHDSAIIDMADGCLALDETGANDNAVLV